MKIKKIPIYKSFKKEVGVYPKEFFMKFYKKDILILLSTKFVRSYWNVYCKKVPMFDVYTEKNCWFAQNNKEDIIDEFIGYQNDGFDEFFIKCKEIVEKIHDKKDKKEYDCSGFKINDDYRNFKLKFNVDHPGEYFKKFSKKELLKLFNTRYIKIRWNYCSYFLKPFDEITEENCQWAKESTSLDLAYDFTQDGLPEKVIMNAKKIIDRIKIDGDNFKDNYSEYSEFQKKFKQKAEDFFMKFSKKELVSIFNNEYIREEWNICDSVSDNIKLGDGNCNIMNSKKEKIIEYFLNDLLDEKFIIEVAEKLIKNIKKY